MDDPSAAPGFATLLGHADFVRGLARSLCYEADADDIAQQAWLAALTRPPRHGENPKGWLATVVRRLAWRLRRGEGRRRAREDAVAVPEPVASTADVLARESVRRQVVEAVLALPEPFRSAVIWHHFEGGSPTAIAERLGIPAATVRTRLHRAHATLRQALDERHGRDRRAWALVLVPLAGPRPARVPGQAARPVRPLPVAAAVVVGVGALLAIRYAGDRPEADLGSSGPATPTKASVPRTTDPGSRWRPTRGAPPAGPGAPTPGGAGPASPPIGRGRVVRADTGEPAAEAIVATQSDHSWLAWPAELPMGSDVDDAGGFDILDDMRGARLLAVLPGVGCSEWVTVPETPGEMVLRVVPGNVLEGTVVDATTSAPIPEAWVEVQMLVAGTEAGSPGAPGSPVLADLQTGPDGKYRVAGVPPGTVLRVVHPGDGAYEATGDPFDWQVEVDEAGLLDRLVRDRAARRMGGPGDAIRWDLALTPRPGVRVTYRLRFPPGETLPETVEALHLTEPLPGAGGTGAIALKLGGSTATADPGPGGVATAEVTDATGTRREVRDGTGWTFGGESRRLDPAAPVLESHLGLGRHHAQLRAGRFHAALAPRLVARGGPPEEVVVDLRPDARVVAQLVDLEGRPVRRAGMRIGVSRYTGGMVGMLPFSDHVTVTSDADGRADLDGQAAAPWVLDEVPESVRAHYAEGLRLTVRDAEGDPAGIPMWITPDRLARWRAEATPGGPVVVPLLADARRPARVRVVDESGNPRRGVRVSVRPAASFEEPRTAVSDENGMLLFRLAAPRAGTPPAQPATLEALEDCQLLAIVEEPGLYGVALALGWHRTPEDAEPPWLGPVRDLVAVPAREVAVRFTDRMGRPLAGAPIRWCLDAGLRWERGETDGEGRLVIAVPHHGRPVSLGTYRAGGDRRTEHANGVIAPGEVETTLILYTLCQGFCLRFSGTPPNDFEIVKALEIRAFDAEGREVRNPGKGLSTTGKPDPHIRTPFFVGPPTVRRFEVRYMDRRWTLDLADGGAVEPPIWDVD